MRALGPRTIRVTAIAARYSSSPRSSAWRIAVSGLARKFCTMTSCSPPYRRPTARSANTVSARSTRVSPIPTSSPEVNGTDSRPASSSTRSRTSGSLSGDPKCASPFVSKSRREVVSSIIPIDGDTGLRRVISSHDMTPGLRCGSRPGLLQHPHRHRADVGQRGVVALLVQPRPRLGPPVLRAVAQGEERLQAPQLGTLAGDGHDLVRRQVRRPPLPRRLRRRLHERAVVAPVPAQPGDRDEDLRRVRHDTRPTRGHQPGVAHPRGHRGQPVEVLAGRRQQHGGLVHVHGRTPLGARERAAYLLRGGHRLRHDTHALAPLGVGDTAPARWWADRPGRRQSTRIHGATQGTPLPLTTKSM